MQQTGISVRAGPSYSFERPPDDLSRMRGYWERVTSGSIIGFQLVLEFDTAMAAHSVLAMAIAATGLLFEAIVRA